MQIPGCQERISHLRQLPAASGVGLPAKLGGRCLPACWISGSVRFLHNFLPKFSVAERQMR